MVNVPAGVWIDEDGRIVRPPEVAYSRQWRFGELVVGDDRYAEGLRDWVANGAKSRFVMSPDQVHARLDRDPQRARADAHFQLAAWLHRHGRSVEAEPHWAAAQSGAADNWNYHRQPWSFDPATAGTKWWARFQALDGAPYYEPAALPADEDDTDLDDGD